MAGSVAAAVLVVAVEGAACGRRWRRCWQRWPAAAAVVVVAVVVVLVLVLVAAAALVLAL